MAKKLWGEQLKIILNGTAEEKVMPPAVELNQQDASLLALSTLAFST